MAGEAYVTADNLDERVAVWKQDLAPHVRYEGPGDLSRAALLLVDLQGFFLKPESHAYLPAAAAMVERLEQTAQAFRQAGNPVYWTRHAHQPGEPARAMTAWWKDLLREGDPLCLLDPRFEIGPLDLVLGKSTYNGFAGTALTTVLEERGVDTLVIGGVMTHLCVETTAREAFCRDFHAVVLLDGTAAPDESLHLSALRTLAHGVARVITCSEARAALPGEAG